MPLPPPEKPVATPSPLISEDAQKLGLKPEHAPKFYRVAVQAVESGDLEDAEAAAFVAASADGSRPEYWLLLGLTRAKQAKLNEAKHAFERAVQLDPANVGGWTNLGEAHISLKDFSAAQQALQKAIELDPQVAHPSSRRARMLLVSRPQWKNGISF